MKLYTEGPQMLKTNVQNLVTWRPCTLYPCLKLAAVNWSQLGKDSVNKVTR